MGLLEDCGVLEGPVAIGDAYRQDLLSFMLGESLEDAGLVASFLPPSLRGAH